MPGLIDLVLGPGASGNRRSRAWHPRVTGWAPVCSPPHSHSHPVHSCSLTPSLGPSCPLHAEGSSRFLCPCKPALLVCIYPEGSLWSPQPLGGESSALVPNLGPLQVSGGLGAPVISGCLVGSPSFPAPRDSREAPSLEEHRERRVNLGGSSGRISEPARTPASTSQGHREGRFSMPNLESQCWCGKGMVALVSVPRS